MRKKAPANIDPQDVFTLAKAMRNQSVELSRSGTRPFYWCLFCDARLFGDINSPLVFIHDPDCPTRIADRLIKAINSGAGQTKKKKAPARRGRQQTTAGQKHGRVYM